MEEKIYLDFVPNEFKSYVRKKICKYDIEKHKWYTTVLKIFLKIQLAFGHQ